MGKFNQTLAVKLGDQFKSQMNKEFPPMSLQYLVYDIESVVDKALLNKIHFSGQGLTNEEAYKKHVEVLTKDGGSSFVNAAFHIPVCLAAAAIDKEFNIVKLAILGEGKRTPGAIVQHFWDTYNKMLDRDANFTLVDFNGRGYDIRLMELWAYRQGIAIHYKHFDKFGVRYRYSDDKHMDLHEVLTNNLSIRYQGGLNLFAKLLAKPGKMETKGDMVQELFDAGNISKIEDYCMGDVMDTYFVFLRWMVVRGKISLAREKDLVEKATTEMRKYSDETGYLKAYIANCTEWRPQD